MKTRTFIYPSILGALVFAGCKSEVKQPAKPNVVYILTDQWRGSALGYAGDPNVKTPNLDKFAQRAVNFKNAVSVCPVSGPHRASLLTGKYPTSTGFFLNDLYLPSEELCIAEIYKAGGYNTAYLGKWHVDGHGRFNNVEPDRRQGFDFWKALECSHDYNKMPYYENDDPQMKYWEGYSPYALAREANRYMEQHQKDEKPFLLFVAIAAPHFPHNTAPEDMKALYPMDQVKLNPNVPKELEANVRKEIQGYYGHCSASDKAIGMIIDKLDELKLMDNTIVVFTSDHGEMMGAHGIRPRAKQLYWTESANVPFLISYPGIGKNKGKVVNAPINTPDILPSLLSLSGLDIPESLEGEDMSDLIKHPDPEADNASLIMSVCPFGWKLNEFRAVKTKQYTYVRELSGPTELFDDVADPFQMNNLVGKPEYAEVQKDLDNKLNELLKKTNDEFKDRNYYIKKWNLVTSDGNQIDYWSTKDPNHFQQPHL